MVTITDLTFEPRSPTLATSRSKTASAAGRDRASKKPLSAGVAEDALHAAVLARQHEVGIAAARAVVDASRALLESAEPSSPARDRPSNAVMLQRKVQISSGMGGGLYTSANVRALLDIVAKKIGSQPVKRGPLPMVHSEGTYTFAKLEDLAHYMTAYYAVPPEPEGLPEPTIEYGAAHGDYHFTGHVTKKKAQWTLPKTEALALMEAELGKYIGRLMAESRADGWETWYVGGDAGENIGNTVEGKEQRFCMQVQVNASDNVITYHGYPDQRLLTVGAGKSKSAISGGE